METVKCLKHLEGGVTLYGITLNKESTIGKATKAIIAPGGSEKAFAGTRSVTLTLACMAYICADLGILSTQTIQTMVDFEQDNLEAMHAAVALLHSKKAVLLQPEGACSAHLLNCLHSGAKNSEGCRYSAMRLVSYDTDRLRYSQRTL